MSNILPLFYARIDARIRRIEAVTGAEAEALARQVEETLSSLAALLKTQPPKVEERVEKLIEENKQMAQALKQAQKERLEQVVNNLIAKAEKINQVDVLTAKLSLTPEELRICAESAASKLHSGVIVLAVATDDKCHFIARVSDDLTAKGINANEIVKAIAPIIEGTGGGKANSAQAGGKAPHKIEEALAKVRQMF